MHSAYNRLNAIFTYALTVLVVAAFLSHLTSFAIKQEPSVLKLRLHDFKYLRAEPNRGYLPAGDASDFTFDLTADLRPVWTWNTKQLFVYITAEYANDLDSVNQVVVWDRIIRSKDEANLDLYNEATEYGLQDHGNNLKGLPVSLTFTYNEMPLTGFLLWTKKGSDTFTMPKAYTS